MLLGQIAERNHDRRRYDLGNGGVDMELLYEQFQKDIIEQDANQNQYEVTE